MSGKPVKQFGFYLAVGIIGSIIDFAVFAGLNTFAFSTVTAQWGAALVGNSHNHVWHFYKIFDHDQGLSKTYIFTLILAAILYPH